MDRSDRMKWALGVIDANGGTVAKAIVVGKAMGILGLSHTGAYDMVNALVGAGHVREFKKDRQKFLVIVRESP